MAGMTDFSLETLEAWRRWHSIFKEQWKKKIVNPFQISLRNEGEIRALKKEVKSVATTSILK